MADFPPVASLRSFEAVARLGSVTQAAHEMSVTHSAVSQHIKQLEALVGVSLFVRHGRGVRITEEGRLYALQIREALQHIADATRMVQIKPRTLEVTLATVSYTHLDVYKRQTLPLACWLATNLPRCFSSLPP